MLDHSHAEIRRGDPSTEGRHAAVWTLVSGNRVESSPYAITNEFIQVVYADEGIVCDIRYFG